MPKNTFLNKTRRYSRHTYGDDGLRGRRNICSVSFVATDLQRPAAGSNTAVAAAFATSTGATTVTTGLTNPDVPRNLVIKPGGTAADVASGTVTITGTNVEGKVIAEEFTTVADTVTAIVGNKAFKTVTSAVVSAQDGAGATFSIGVGSKLGIGMRNLSSMPVKVLTRAADGTEALEDASASAFSSSAVESNTVTTTTAPDGAVGFRVYVLNYKWHVNPTNGNPDYGV